MSQFPCSFDPCDSDTWVNVGEEEEDYSYDYASPPEIHSHSAPIPQSPGMYPLPQIDITPSESESDIPVATNADTCVTTTDLAHLKTVIQTKTNYDGSCQLSTYLKHYPGIIIMPLSCISYVRKPVGHHKANPQVLVYAPGLGQTCTGYPDFEEAVSFFNGLQ